MTSSHARMGEPFANFVLGMGCRVGAKGNAEGEIVLTEGVGPQEIAQKILKNVETGRLVTVHNVFVL